MRRKEEPVVVIGAGSVGTNAALFLDKLGFSVELIDTAPDILQGASQVTFINHGDGFEYHKPRHRRTGELCIDGSITKALIYPLSALRTQVCDDNNPIRFMVARASLGKMHLTMDSFYKNAEHMSYHFSHQFRSVMRARGWHDEETELVLMRHPRSFFRRLEPSDYSDIANVVGGCAGSSFGVNMPHYYALLRAALVQSSISFRPSTEVESIEKAAVGYRIHAGGSTSLARHVIVAASHHIPWLTMKIHRARIASARSGMYYLNSMTLLRLPATRDPEILMAAKRINFTLQQDGGAMLACIVPPTEIADGIAATYFPSELGSQRDRHYFEATNPTPPPAMWDRLIAEGLPSEDPNVAITFRQACSLYPFLHGYADILSTKCRVVFNVETPKNKEGRDRRVREISATPIILTEDGRISMWTAPKWTNAELVALMAADHVLTVASGHGLSKGGHVRFGVTSLDMTEITENINFWDVRMRVHDAIRYAFDQGLPERVVEPTISQFRRSPGRPDQNEALS